MLKKTNRRSYSGLMSLPVFGLYDKDKLVATIRASGDLEAKEVFRAHGFSVDTLELRKLP